MMFRRAAMDWLAVRTNDGADPISYTDVEDFRFNGEKISLRSRYKGIWKPANFSAALSFSTMYPRPGKDRPYDDVIGDDGLMRYKKRRDKRGISDNRAMSDAMEMGLPLVWYYAVATGLFQAIFPVFIVAEEEDQFAVVVDEAQRLYEDGPIFDYRHSMGAMEKRYAIRMARQRLHQPVFRSMVMRAYGERCAVCALNHAELLDAAHILPDSHAEGIASVTNGLSLCKIHHSAYDRKFLGITSEYIVEIRADLLEEVDGPMLRHGLQECHKKPLRIRPERADEWPSKELLGRAYAAFRKAA
ncbi:HNH endonuclease [Kocuria rosea]|uniref:HNH endonuclease n=2 Tax=Kocuria rosea TaxID=1275 RepID=A0A4V6PNI0_KOCRO|nr:HNH endonuclease [Kocuria rosea]